MKYLLKAVTLSMVCATPSYAEDLEVGLTFGTAAVGTVVTRSDGTELIFDSGTTGSIGVAATYDLQAPTGNDAGFRYGLLAGASWHPLSATTTDADLGDVTLENNWSASVSSRAGYDFGMLFPYAIAGLGISDANVSTQGAAIDNRISVGTSFGIGIEADFNDTWSGQIEALEVRSPDFTPAGGGRATTSVGEIRLGISAKF